MSICAGTKLTTAKIYKIIIFFECDRLDHLVHQLKTGLPIDLERETEG